MTTKQLAGDTLAPATAARRARTRAALPAAPLAAEPPAAPAAVIRTVLIASCGWPGPDMSPSRRAPARRR